MVEQQGITLLVTALSETNDARAETTDLQISPGKGGNGASR